MIQKKQNILFFSVITFWFAQYVYIPFQTPYLSSIKVSADFIGIIIGTYGISQMLLRLPVGVLADSRNRHKQFIMIGGLSAAAASLFRVLLNNHMGFFIGNLLSGLASAMWISFMVLYMSYYPAREQQKATSRVILANNAGILSGFIASTLLYNLVGMRVICLLSVIGGLITMFLSFFLPKGEEKDCHLTIPQLLSVCSQKRLWLFSLFALVQQGVQMSTTMSFTTQILKDLGANALTVGGASVIYMLSAVGCSKFASTKLCNRLSPGKWISLTFAVNALYCVLIPSCSRIPSILILQLLPGMSTGILFSFLTSEAMKQVPREKKSTAMGLYQAVYALGMTLLPMLSGVLAEKVSMKGAYLCLAGICILASLGSMGYYRLHRR